MGKANAKAGILLPMLRKTKRFVIMVVGTTALFLGVAMIVLPGPAIVMIPAGLAILCTEFAWARRWLRLIRDSAQKGIDKAGTCGIFSGAPAGDLSSQGSSSSAGSCNEPEQRNPTA